MTEVIRAELLTGMRLNIMQDMTGIRNAIALLFCVALGCSDPDPSQGQTDETLEKVTFNMAWLPQGSMAGIIVAIDKGYYREAGLDVEPIRGFGGLRTVNELDQGMFEFGYGDPLAVILNRARGGKTRLIGSINNRWPAGLCYVKERHTIRQPSDLQGLTIGGGQNSAVQVIVPEWLEINGVDPDTVTMLQLQPSVIASSLVEGKIDAGECWKGNSLPVFNRIARDAGLTIDWLEYGQFNLDIYGNGLVTTEQLIEERPEVVRRFVQATYKGYHNAINNIDEAVAIMVKHFPVLDPDITRQQITGLAELIQGPDTMGWINEEKVANTLAFLTNAYDVQETIPVDEIYTLKFLDNDETSLYE